MKKKFHREKCEARVRMQITDQLGRKITLVGKHAFEWSIILESDGKIIITTFKDRKSAVEDLKKYKP